MKILAINICNLNSLVGKQTIDFREEPLQSAGLYAIVGPTGAGKSTVLDAITLALYGRTERDSYGAEVMSHGTGECFAEVIFETGEGTFLSRWERRRARQRPDGNLQTAQLQLSRQDPKDGQFRPLPADRLNEVKELTRQTIGLDYDQFVRSVMLTQGQFARFLSSSTKERADILEKITGTEIYSRISQAAFERHKLARENFDRLRENQRHLLPLNEAERGELQASHDRLQAEITQLRPQLTELRRQRELFHLVRVAGERRDQEQQSFDGAEREWVALEPIRSALTASRRLHALREPLAGHDRLKREAANTEVQLTTLVAQREVLDREATRREELASAAERAWKAFDAAKPLRMERLATAAGLETQLSVRSREEANDKPERTRLEERIQALERSVSALATETAELRDLLGHREPETINHELAKSEDRLQRLTDRRDILREWQHRMELEVRLRELRLRTEEDAKEGAALRARHASALAAVGAAEEDLATRRRILTRLEQSKGIDHLRSDLGVGEPCPLCGSVHHPALEDGTADLDADIQVGRRDVRTATETVEGFRKEERHLATTIAQLETRLEDQRHREQEVTTALAQAPPPGERPAGTLKEATELLERVNAEGKTTQDSVKGLRQLRSAAGKLTELLPKWYAHRKELGEQRDQLVRLRARATQRVSETAELSERRRQLIGGDSVESARRELDREETILRDDRTNKRSQLQQAVAEAKNSAARIADRQQQLANLRTEAAGLLDGMHQLLGRLELASLDDARAILLPPDREEAYAVQQQRVELRRHAQREKLTAAETEYRTARAAVQDIPAVSVLEEQLVTLEERAESLNQHLGSVQKELEQDDERRFAFGVLKKELERAEAERQRWARLNDLIGQKDGVKFSRFAQTLTLQRLVEAGNRHLYRINERYRMRHRAAEDMSRENLELEIIDTFQNDNCRPMTTLSGGETFIVSLALALGLSELASGQTNIRSLFIDEGFGTLDEKILDDAVSALEQLQGQGKTIGLISHVKELRERIYCQIQLTPRGSGRSQLSVTPSVS